jgi:hypothetical protein
MTSKEIQEHQEDAAHMDAPEFLPEEGSPPVGNFFAVMEAAKAVWEVAYQLAVMNERNAGTAAAPQTAAYRCGHCEAPMGTTHLDSCLHKGRVFYESCFLAKPAGNVNSNETAPISAPTMGKVIVDYCSECLMKIGKKHGIGCPKRGQIVKTGDVKQ